MNISLVRQDKRNEGDLHTYLNSRGKRKQKSGSKKEKEVEFLIILSLTFDQQL